MKNRTLWIGAAVLVVVLGVVAAVVGGGGGDDGPAADGSATQDVSITGAALPPLPDSGDDPAVGVEAPAVEGASFDGSAVSIAPGDAGGKVVLFVAHWCPHCQREVPFLVDHLAENPLPADVELLMVSTGVDEKAPNYPPQEWLADEGWTTPVIADSADGDAAVAYGLTGYPYFVAVRPDGTVAARASGELTADQFEALVAAAEA